MIRNVAISGVDSIEKAKRVWQIIGVSIEDSLIEENIKHGKWVPDNGLENNFLNREWGIQYSMDTNRAQYTYREFVGKYWKGSELAEVKQSKYDRLIVGKDGKACTVDVYDVLKAFNVTNPALQHLVKKALCVGVRGHKDSNEDLQDIIDSAIIAKELEEKQYV